MMAELLRTTVKSDLGMRWGQKRETATLLEILHSLQYKFIDSNFINSHLKANTMYKIFNSYKLS